MQWAVIWIFGLNCPLHTYVVSRWRKSSRLNILSLFHRYAQLCQNLLEENVETGEQFSQEFLPSLLYLLTDPVPNVRLSLARTLSQSVTVLGIVHLLQVIFMHSMSSGIVLEATCIFLWLPFFFVLSENKFVQFEMNEIFWNFSKCCIKDIPY